MEKAPQAHARLEQADNAVEQAKRILKHAETSGEPSKVKEAEKHLQDCLNEQSEANENLRVLRGDYLDTELAKMVSNGIDRSLLATPDQLINAFGRFSGMDSSWFQRLDNTPGLKNARKIRGQSKHGQSLPPMFCPFEVCQWVADQTRKKGRKTTAETAWRLLESHFKSVYEKHQHLDPRD